MRFFFLLTFFIPTTLLAQVPVIVPTKLDGTRSEVAVDIATVKQVVFWAESKGNITSPLTLTVDAAPGTSIKTEAAQVIKSNSFTLARPDFFYELSLKGQAEARKEALSMCAPLNPEELEAPATPLPYPPLNDPVCQMIPQDVFGDIATQLSITYGGSYSYEQVCGFIAAQYMGGAEMCDLNELDCQILLGIASVARSVRFVQSTQSRFSGVAMINKDNCSSATKYLVKVTVDLTAVDVEKYPTVNVQAQLREFKFTGSRAASIKPISDGRFAPKPLILMSYLGTLCGQQMNLAVWSGKKPVFQKKLKVYDMLPWKKWILTRTPIDGLLSGGKGTFELFSDRDAYGVCFQLKRKRQKANGYK